MMDPEAGRSGALRQVIRDAWQAASPGRVGRRAAVGRRGAHPLDAVALGMLATRASAGTRRRR
jgi:hypothetical protein